MSIMSLMIVVLYASLPVGIVLHNILLFVMANALLANS